MCASVVSSPGRRQIRHFRPQATSALRHAPSPAAALSAAAIVTKFENSTDLPTECESAPSTLTEGRLVQLGKMASTQFRVSEAERPASDHAPSMCFVRAT